MTTKVNETAQQTSIVPFQTVVPSAAPLSFPVPSRSSMDINLVAPKFRAKLVKEQALVEEKRRAERRRIEQEKYTRSRQLSRRAVFTSD